MLMFQFTLQQQLITLKKFEEVKTQTTVIHGWDIRLLSPA